MNDLYDIDSLASFVTRGGNEEISLDCLMFLLYGNRYFLGVLVSIGEIVF